MTNAIRRVATALRKVNIRWHILAGAIMALAVLVPAASAVAQTGSPGLNEAGLNEAGLNGAALDGTCQTADPKVYKDIRELLTIDLDTASNIEVRVLANQILFAATQESLALLPGQLQQRLDGTADDLRAFLKTDVLTVWNVDLRIAVNQTMPGAGPHVLAAAQMALDDGSIDALLAYLNDGLYAARALDCASPSPSVSPSPPSPRPVPTPPSRHSLAPVGR